MYFYLTYLTFSTSVCYYKQHLGPKNNQSRFSVFRHIQVDPCCKQTPGFQFDCANLINIHSRIVDVKELCGKLHFTNGYPFLTTNIGSLYCLSFFTRLRTINDNIVSFGHQSINSTVSKIHAPLLLYKQYLFELVSSNRHLM